MAQSHDSAHKLLLVGGGESSTWVDQFSLNEAAENHSKYFSLLKSHSTNESKVTQNPFLQIDFYKKFYQLENRGTHS